MSEPSREITYIMGITIGVLSTLVIVFLLAKASTPSGWCQDIAQHEKTVTYTESYNKCIAEYTARRNESREKP